VDIKTKQIAPEVLWKEFIENDSQPARHQLIVNYVGLVKYVIFNMNMPANSLLEEQDFMNIGVIGLCEAIERYDPARGVKFESYAVPRIRGKIQDEMRRLDWLSRTARKKATELIEVTDRIRSEKGREVSHEEVIERLGITTQQFQSYLDAAAAAKASISLNEAATQVMTIDDETFDPLMELPDEDYINKLDEMQNIERVAHITNYLQTLKEKKRLVISLYYYEELTFKEIGQLLDISESRVCQIHAQVIKELRSQLHEYENA
jgi:RNA polymerase sigma factor for flagellar operon FliA